MRYNTLKELTDVINILWEIEDVALSNCGPEGEQAIRAAIESVQKAWNVCKRGMENKGMDTSVYSSRNPIKSSAAPDGLTFDSREDEDGYKFIQYKITDQSRLDKIKGYCDHDEDELQLGKTFLNLMYDESDKLLAAQLVDTDSSTWEVSPEECVEVFGSSIETLSDSSVGKHAVDEFMDYDVDPVQSAHRPIKSEKKYNVIDRNGGVVGQPKSYEDACDEAEEIGGTVKPVESSRKSVKSGLDFVQKGEVILAKKGTKVVGYIGQNADKEFYYGLGTPGKSSGVMVVSDFNSAAKRLEEQSRQ